MKPKPIRPGPGQESVWDYPRPPRLEPFSKSIEIYFNGQRIANSNRIWRVLETSHPPVYYLPDVDVEMTCMKQAAGGSWCEWKGQAVYFDVQVGDKIAPRSAWSYPRPTADFSAIRDHLAFYAWAMDRCLVDGQLVRPQPGNFYGGWVTDNVVGPFKGEPGSSGW